MKDELKNQKEKNNLTLIISESLRKNQEELNNSTQCFKYRARRCCFSISLDDGLLGIVVWDLLYALFIVTTTLSILVNHA